ncbi:MAG: HypC/HybG/HupF family hydrogenase formation chaperone [Gammaproteobacteria bacterium]|nr:HypC/HybG/HupF family hydrogenase formation chaperone [Gammaproteobacteria bacterium]MBU1416550.1 HypC/HybG/HupF family hydrogenase formation chaperone [Gammaproteobacteria bacterium]
MCLAVPSRIIALDGEIATVEAFGETRQVSLLLMPEEVALGDYLLIQAGGFAFERVEADRAEESLRVMAELMVADSTDVRAW